MSATKKLHTTGMHCKSCEIMIRDAIEEIKGCKVSSISNKTGLITVHMPDESYEEKIRAAIRSGGYRLTDEANEEIEKSRLLTKILWLLFAGVLLYIFLKFNISRALPTYDTLGFGIALLVGLVASISTCLAVTGGIIIGYTESIVDKTDGWKTQLRFHMWRIITFTLGGFILGMLWRNFSGSVFFNGALSVFVGFVLAYLGLQLLWIVPNISKIGLTLPLFFTRNITRLKSPKYAPWVGALTFLLPCGFTQSMMIFALSSHDPFQGALVMGGFALGTLPVLLALGIGTEYIKDHLKILNPFIASLLVVFWAFTALNGWKILDAVTPEKTVVSSEASPISKRVLETEEVSWSHNGYGFSPRILNLEQWKNYTITVTPEANWLGCFYSVIIPWKGEQYIKKWEKFTISVNGSIAKNIPLVCGSMGMSQGKIVIK